MTEKLKTPPLVTAFCRFDYKPTDELDWTIPGSLFEVIKAQYPKKQQLFSYEVELEEEQPAEPSSIAKNPIGMEFSNPDRTRFVRVGPTFLEVRQSETYSGWDRFEIDILDIYDTHRDIAENPRLMGISLRYINRVTLKKITGFIGSDHHSFAQPTRRFGPATGQFLSTVFDSLE